MEKILESPLDCKEIKPVNPKGYQSWMFIWRTDTEAKAPILWPLDGKSWLIRKNPDVGKNWGQEEKGTTEDKMVGWHHWLNGCEFEQTPGNGEGQGSLVCCSPWACKQLDTTDWLNNNRSGIVGSYGNSMLNFLRSHQSVFYSGCTILNSQQQRLRVSISLPSYEYLLFKKIIVILVGVNCYLIVALTCTYLMTNNIEYLFMCLLAICTSSWGKCLFKSFAHF